MLIGGTYYGDIYLIAHRTKCNSKLASKVPWCLDEWSIRILEDDFYLVPWFMILWSICA